MHMRAVTSLRQQGGAITLHSSALIAVRLCPKPAGQDYQQQRSQLSGIGKPPKLDHQLAHIRPLSDEIHPHTQSCNLAYWDNRCVTPQLVWKMFCTMLLLQRVAAASSSATSPLLNRQPRAPRFSLACARSFAPGIGTVPLQMHQLIAT
jgi:hypothetical protein